MTGLHSQMYLQIHGKAADLIITAAVSLLYSTKNTGLTQQAFYEHELNLL